MRTGIALGSNLGDRLENLKAARKAIVDLGIVKSPVLASVIYETEPIDCEPGAGKFLNAVIEFEFEGDPMALLNELVRIEESSGRERGHARPPSPGYGAAGNVSRKIDIDLLYCGDVKIDNNQLQLPHPRLHLRRFVLQPLADIRPDSILPSHTKTVRELLAQLNESAKVKRFTNDW